MTSKLPSWDLTDLYKDINDVKITKDLNRFKKLNLDLAKKYKGKLADISANDFYLALKNCEESDIIEHALGEFAYLNMVTQMNNKSAMAFYQDITEKLNEYGKPAIFFSLEVNKLPEDKFKALLKDKKVAEFAPFLKNIRLYKKYELPEKVEEVFHEKNITSGSAWVRLYEETCARLKYNVDGKSYNDAEVSKLMQDKNPLVREKAGKEFNRVSGENKELFSFIYNMIIKDKSISDKKRGFKSPIASQNLANRVEDKAVIALANTVKSRYAEISHRFYKLKAKWLGVNKLQYWDRNAPLPFSDDTQYTWDESVDIVLKAYQQFSPKLRKLADGFFKNNWIDVPPRDGKRSGAFACPLPNKYHPYLLLNFVGKQNDVLTLAHELGHGCHFLLSQTQGELNDSTPLTLAEVASVFGEMVTFQSMVKNQKDDKIKLCLIASKVNDMINTAVRQIAFHFFESRAHMERNNGELQPERLQELWLEEMRSSLGEWVNVDENSANIWSQIGHFFFQPFYVYAYSFADCLVNSLYQVYQKGSIENFEDKYLDMLSQTGVKKYDELLKPFGLDAKQPDFWNMGLNLISDYIDELERLDKKIFG